MEERHIGYEVRTLKNMIGHLICHYQSQLDEEAGITQVQGWIIGYLSRNQDRDVFQKDLEADFHIAGSTATGILKTMEKNGLITRQPLMRDARLKRLVLTEQGQALNRAIKENLEKTQQVLQADISEEDLEIFYKVVEQIKGNIEREIKQEMKGELPKC